MNIKAARTKVGFVLVVFALLYWTIFLRSTEGEFDGYSNSRYFPGGRWHALAFMPFLPLEYVLHRPVVWVWLDSKGCPSHFSLGLDL